MFCFALNSGLSLGWFQHVTLISTMRVNCGVPKALVCVSLPSALQSFESRDDSDARQNGALVF